MPSSHALVPAHVCVEVKRLYEERDARGRRVWSQMAIGKRLGLSETTIYRIVNNSGPYQDLARLKSSTEMSADAAASAAKLLKMLQSPDNQGEKNERPADPNSRIDPADGRTERLDTISGRWIKLPY